MNGHIERRTSKTKGTRYRVLIFVDAEHGGPGWQVCGTFDRQSEAKAMLVKALDAYYSTGAYRKPSRLTVRELYERWRAVKAPTWTPNTARHHAMNFAHHIAEELGDEQAEMLAKDRIAVWQADLLSEGCKPKSVSSYRGTLHAMYAWAMSVDLVAVNPVAAVKPPQVKRAEHDALTVEEMRAYIDHLRGTRLWPGLLLGAGGALRRGEFLAVRWRNLCWSVTVDEQGTEHWSGGVEIDHRRGNLTGGTRATLQFGKPKTRESIGFVPLPEFALRELAALKHQRQLKWAGTGRTWSDEALVCCGAMGQPIIPDGFTHELRRFCLRHNLAPTHAHAFRHGVIEAMLAAGERLDVVQKIARHTQPSTTLGIYAHVTKRAQQEASERYGGLWGTPACEPDDAPDPGIRNHSATISAGGDELAVRRRRRVPA